MLKKIIFIIALLFVSYNASANTCYDSINKGSAACAAYQYDVFTLYFKDENNSEHKVYAKRVIQRSNGVLVHVDYDFVSACTSQCSELDNIANETLWAFRNANQNNTFYQKVVYVCDPTEEVCCNDTGCNEIYKVGNPSSELATVKENLEYHDDKLNEIASKRGPKYKNGDIIDKGIYRTEAITNVADNMLRNSSNGQQVQQGMALVTVQPIQFQIFNSISGAVKICVSSGSFCEEIQGYGTASNNMASFELSHNQGQNFNTALRDFIERAYQVDKQMTCSQSTSCSSENHCTVRLTCIKY
ncbi:hypothetical protein [Rheinheimera salexigens]|uniref:Uncharacterized protein n=1 Tax=Rheinheimera salexigens TaxID=1628148 RepID=A0A1E7Q469_9GAMM|nr:hypothetical protein [Rheinheimera salexigens]OEY68975.1 hypothetical protein BI198_04875 [Rheinheimera salexigens]